MTDTRETFTYQLRIDASPEVVFTYFTDPHKMGRWMGIAHQLQAIPGGAFIVDINGQDVAEGHFVELDPPRRVVFTWGWRNSSDLPPGSTTVEVDLTPDGHGTLLDFAHHGLTAGPEDRHAQGWDHYLRRLGLAAAGGDTGPDHFAELAR